MKGISTFQICRILEFEKGRLREWIDKGYIYPSIQKSTGHGSRNLFSRWDLYGIAIFDILVRNGHRREIAKHHYDYWSETTNKMPLSKRKDIKFLCRYYGAPRTSEGRILVGRKRFKILNRNFETIELCAIDQGTTEVVLINIESVISRIDERFGLL